MNIITKAKNLELGGDMQKFIEEKVGSLEKFINAVADIYVEVGKETEHHKKGQIFSCQMEVKLPGKNLVAKANSDELQKAIIEAKNELEEGIKKYKVKKVEFSRRIRRKTKNEIEK